MANEEHLAILKQDVDTWNKWRHENWQVIPDLSGADLYETNLGMADLRNANLSKANLGKANLSEANLREANLSGAKHREAYLFSAGLNLVNLQEVDLYLADFGNADLWEADLSGTNLSMTSFVLANLSGSILKSAAVESIDIGDTILTDIDLSPFVNTLVSHHGPSTVDHRSIANSLHCTNLLPFLVDTGIPLIVATYLIDSVRSLDPNQLFNLMHSTFISYGGPDETFANKLQAALQTNGVTTFLFKKDAVPGQAISDVMRNQVRRNDRIVVICSEDSLDRSGVLNEIELTLRREAREGGHILLIPIALDEYVFEKWDPENENLKEAVLERVIADFVGAENNQSKFDQGIERLLQALKVSLPTNLKVRRRRG